MKMFGKKSLSHFLFYGTRVTAFGSLLLLGFILFSFAFGNYTLVDNQFQIAIPFFNELYIKGFYERGIIITIALVLFYIVAFFYVLSLILNSFKSEKLFTVKVVRFLNRFAFLNLLLFPVLYLFLHFVILDKPHFSGFNNMILSVICGILVLFIAAIFKRGLKVQAENDLTI